MSKDRAVLPDMWKALAIRLFEMWEQDREMKLGKMLRALTGEMPGYSSEVDKFLQSLSGAGIEIKYGKVLEGQTRDDGIEAALQKILWCSRIAGDENAIRFHNSVVNECYQAVNSMLSVPPTDSTKESER